MLCCLSIFTTAQGTLQLLSQHVPYNYQGMKRDNKPAHHKLNEDDKTPLFSVMGFKNCILTQAPLYSGG